ncbi:hypothetical protein Poly41_65260 [Novipirellula artificiosorum]|uniref:Uncharacterized protein n=1 Tax=Novipirellula artificiosorum TaxID=2528016 RepID=A0A5C6D1N1_9BACT|nr:hypothetical protein Poly41_65260 [Novipirellula artificiosorum]
MAIRKTTTIALRNAQSVFKKESEWAQLTPASRVTNCTLFRRESCTCFQVPAGKHEAMRTPPSEDHFIGRQFVVHPVTKQNLTTRSRLRTICVR